MQYLNEFVSFILGALAGGFAVKVSINRSQRSATTQAGNTAGGDIAGRDINKRK